MDQETREFLDQKFNTIDQKFDKIDQNFNAIDQKFDKIDQRFEEAKRDADQKFNAIDQKFEETRRHFDVVAEGLEHKIQLVAEGVVNLDERFGRNLTAFREDNERAHKEILVAIKFSYAELDQRIRTLESGFQTLKTRMDRLEATQN